MSDFAKKLIELRKEKGYSQEKLASKLFVSRQSVSKWENGKSLPSTALIYKIAEIFSVSVDNLIDIQDMRVISIDNNSALSIQSKKNKLIAIILAFTILLSVTGITLGIVIFKQIDYLNLDEQDEFLGILLDINTQYENRDKNIITFEQLQNDRFPYFIFKNTIEEGVAVSGFFSYSFSGGNVRYGKIKEYTNGYFCYDANKIDKNAIVYYYHIMEKSSGEMYLAYNISVHISSLPNYTFLMSDKKIEVSPKKIDSIVELELISYRSDNIVLSSRIIPHTQREVTLEKDVSYVEFKSKYINKDGSIKFLNERKSTKEINENPFYERMLTDERGFLKDNITLKMALDN